MEKSNPNLPLLKKSSKKFSNLSKKEAKMSSLRNRQVVEAICCNLAFKQVVGCLLSTFKPIPERGRKHIEIIYRHTKDYMYQTMTAWNSGNMIVV